MKNTPLASMKVSDRTFEKIQLAVEKSGMDRADVLRWAIRLGLDSLEKIGWDVEGAVSAGIPATPPPANTSNTSNADGERPSDPTATSSRGGVKRESIRNNSR